MPDSPAPSAAPSPRCTATTGKGERCKAYAVKGSTLCLTHSRSPEERKQAAQAAAARSAEVRARVVEEREDALRQARLGLKALLAQRLEEEADAVAERLRRLALSEDDQTALRGIQLWMERVYGRAVQPTRDDTPTVASSLEELEALSLEELADLARRLPSDPEPA